MVSVSLLTVALAYELMPWNAGHRAKNSLIANPAGHELRLDHVLAFG
jgi:hypothetical protein